jgi:hypothetical protein
MTHQSVPPADDPRELLTAVRDLTRRVRLAQRGIWFPLLVLAVITLAAIPVYRFAPHHLARCRSGPHGTSVCLAVIPGVLAYWPVALAAAYTLIAGFYVRQSRRRGVGTPVRPYVVAGLVIAIVATAGALWRASDPVVPLYLHVTPATLAAGALTSPVVAIGLALLVLARVERSWALLAYSAAYLAIVLADSARRIHSSSPWPFLPQLLIPAAVLLAGSAGFALFRPAAEPPPR